LNCAFILYLLVCQMFKNVKIIVLYQNIGGHKGGRNGSTLKQTVGGASESLDTLKNPFLMFALILCHVIF
jgi:hypothetical protein